jgi:hypothetical protein
MAETPSMPPAMLRRHRKFEANGRWATKHEEEFLEHVGRFIAVDDERFLGVADSVDELRQRFPGREGLYVTFVYPPDLAMFI